jgi:hypothetical protein
MIQVKFLGSAPKVTAPVLLETRSDRARVYWHPILSYRGFVARIIREAWDVSGVEKMLACVQRGMIQLEGDA